MSTPAPTVNGDLLRNIATNYESEIGSIAATTLRAIADHVDLLEGEVKRLSPPDGVGLRRFGVTWPDTEHFLLTPMDDGYWTPWCVAADALAAEKARARHWENQAFGYQEVAAREIERVTAEYNRADAAEARCDTLAEALKLIADMRLSAPAEFREIAAEALATIPAKPDTETKP